LGSTYSQQADGVDGELVSLSVRHDCGCRGGEYYYGRREEVWSEWKREKSRRLLSVGQKFGVVPPAELAIGGECGMFLDAAAPALPCK